MALHDQLIAQRFEPLGPVVPGSPIKARDLETAQTVLLTSVKGLDPRVAGIFHPALVTIFAIVEHEGRTLAATEFIHGRTLAELFRGEPCHPRRAAAIVSELSDGIAELHSLNICHGAIGPASAMLTSKGKARVMLTSVVGGSEDADLEALKELLIAIGGHATPESENAQSAAVLAAALRS